MRIRCKEGCLRVNVDDNGTIEDLLRLANADLKKRKSKETGEIISKGFQQSQQ